MNRKTNYSLKSTNLDGINRIVVALLKTIYYMTLESPSQSQWREDKDLSRKIISNDIVVVVLLTRKMKVFRKLYDFVRWFDNYFLAVAILFILYDLGLSIIIIMKIPYTEIDWIAYMHEVGGFLRGNWDYRKLKGPTGPLVYPAGFVYLFSILYHITNDGENVLLAQYIFAGFYIINLAVVLSLYRQARIPLSKPNKKKGRFLGRHKVPVLFACLLLCHSKRIHSIFVLRCFNDCLAMIMMYASIFCYIFDFWNSGLIAFSLGISIKMNVILFLPGLLVLLVKRFGAIGMALRVSLFVVLPQVLLAIPFLMENADGYFNKSFEFSRKFFHIWTVNFKFLPEEIFLNETLHKALVIATGGTMLLFAWFKWCKYDRIVDLFLGRGCKGKIMTAEHIMTVLFSCNFIGIVFSRTLHYQFYVWYFHTLPYLLFSMEYLPTVLKIVMLGLIEWAFNVFPSTFTSSLTLTIVHGLLLIFLIFSKDYKPYVPIIHKKTSSSPQKNVGKNKKKKKKKRNKKKNV